MTDMIVVAQPGDGWCVDCTSACTIGSVSLKLLKESGVDATSHYCQFHREFVQVDDHCREWMKNGS